MRIPRGLACWIGAFHCFLAVAAPEPGAQAVRVVSQTVGSDELLLALAEPAQVAALSQLSQRKEYSAVAEEACRYPQIRSGDAEAVLRFAPTLVLCADYSQPELIVQLRRSGLRVLVFDRYRTLADSYANLRTLARELGAEARAEARIADCERRLAALRSRLRDCRRVRVIAPSVYGVLAGADTSFSDLCAEAGAENLGETLGGLRGHAPAPSEQMLAWPVEVVVVMGQDPAEALAPYREILPYKLMPAVREGRAALLPPNLISCVSHHRIEAYERLARQLHPEAFQ